MTKILLTGGGTGGHIYPLLAVVEKLKRLSIQKRLDLELNYIGAPESYSYLLEKNEIKVSKIASAKRRRYFDPRNLIDALKFLVSVIQAFWKVFWLMPDVLFSKGGPGSYAVVLACSFYRIPIIIHESDSVPGKANLLASKKAARIGISFASAEDDFLNYCKKEKEKLLISQKIALVGNPIREFLFTNVNSEEKAITKKSLGFDSEKPLLLIICGSQGAVRINDFFLTIAEELINNNIQILHQTGIKNFEEFNKELSFVLKNSEQKQKYKTTPYFEEDIKDAYVAADLIISRAGSGSIAEIATAGKPSILLPIPEEIVGLHQIKNAYEYSRTGAAIMIEEENLKPHIFMDQIKKFLNDENKLKNMSEAAKKFAKPQAAEIIAQELINVSLL